MSCLRSACSGCRVLRHFACDPAFTAYGCDIDCATIVWCQDSLAPKVRTFQNTLLPHLPLADNFFDAVLAFSVLTHIDEFETAWLYEIRRIIKPGGVAIITAQTDRNWFKVPERKKRIEKLGERPVNVELGENFFSRPMPARRVVFKSGSGGVQAPSVFHSTEYIKSNWGLVMPVAEIFDAPPARTQDIVVLRKS